VADDAITLSGHEARRYVVIDGSDERQAHAEFAPDVEHSGATLPAPGATVTLRDDAIGVSGVLPRRGTIRVRNTGSRPHHALAVRLPADTSISEAATALRKGTSPNASANPSTCRRWSPPVRTSAWSAR
jgi:hypothetical protein